MGQLRKTLTALACAFSTAALASPPSNDQISPDPNSFLYITHECRGLILRPAKTGDDMVVMMGEPAYPGVFPVIRYQPEWLDGPVNMTLCADQKTIRAEADRLEKNYPDALEKESHSIRSLAHAFALLEFLNRPIDRQTEAAWEEHQKLIEETMTIPKIEAFSRGQLSLIRALRESARIMDFVAEQSGKPVGPAPK